METIRGKMSQSLDFTGLDERLKNYQRVLLDLGTGDGRYVRFLADQHPDWLIIGVDSCRENLREHSRTQARNALFVIASAQNLPQELHGTVSHMTINFPWGSLLKSLLAGDADLLHGLSAVSTPNAMLEIHLNGGALAEAGSSLETGTQAICDNMMQQGWKLKEPARMDQDALRSFPTTWAKRLAHGRDPRALSLRGTLTG